MADLFRKRADKIINIDHLDAVMIERCRPWIDAKEGDTSQKAALQEFIKMTLEIIQVAGNDPLHRDDVIEQARATITFLATDQAKEWPSDLRKANRDRRLEAFNRALVNTLLDMQYGNSLSDLDPAKDQIDKAADSLRGKFRKTIDVFVPNQIKQIGSDPSAK